MRNSKRKRRIKRRQRKNRRKFRKQKINRSIQLANKFGFVIFHNRQTPYYFYLKTQGNLEVLVSGKIEVIEECLNRYLRLMAFS